MAGMRTQQGDLASQRLAALDGLRGIAACGVAFLYHPLLELSADVAPAIPAPVTWLRTWGWTFVDLFFVISGYIFAHVYLQGRRLGRADLGEFAIARIARLYPLHLLMLLVCAFLFGAAPENTWTAFVGHLFMMQAFVEPSVRHFNGPSWSISVEIACYALFALGVAKGDRGLRWVTLAAIAVPLVYLLAWGRPGGPWFADCIPRGPLGFFTGQVLWRCRGRLSHVPHLMLAMLFLVGLLMDTGTLSPLLPLCLLAWPAAVVLSLRVPAMQSRCLLWLGDRSYAIYLVHFPILLYFLPSLHAAKSGWTTSVMIAAFAIVVLLFANLAHCRVEIPARRLIRTLWARRAQRSEGDIAIA